MLKAWSASRSVVLSRDEQVPGQFVYPVVCTAAVNYQTQFIGCFKGIEMDILNSFLGGWWLFSLAHLSAFFELILQMLNSFGDLLVFVKCWTRSCIKWPAFWKGRIMVSVREAAQMFFMSIQEGSQYIALRLTETMYFKILGLSFMGYVTRLWTWKSSICD